MAHAVLLAPVSRSPCACWTYIPPPAALLLLVHARATSMIILIAPSSACRLHQRLLPAALAEALMARRLCSNAHLGRRTSEVNGTGHLRRLEPRVPRGGTPQVQSSASYGHAWLQRHPRRRCWQAALLG
jgi:hypothetical protein